MRRLVVCALFCAASAQADTLTINTRDVSYYFVGDGLTIDGNSMSMAASSVAIGDHPDQRIDRSGFDAQNWSWTISYGETEITGSALCSMETDAPNVRLNCEP